MLRASLPSGRGAGAASPSLATAQCGVGASALPPLADASHDAAVGQHHAPPLPLLPQQPPPPPPQQQQQQPQRFEERPASTHAHQPQRAPPPPPAPPTLAACAPAPLAPKRLPERGAAVGRAPPPAFPPPDARRDDDEPPPSRAARGGGARGGPRGQCGAANGAQACGPNGAAPWQHAAPPPPRPLHTGFESAAKTYADDVAAGRVAPPPKQAPFQPVRALGAAGPRPHQGGAGGGGGAAASRQGAAGGGDGKDEDPAHGLSPSIHARLCPNGEPVPESIRKCEAPLVARICDEILEAPRAVSWDDIAGLEHAKAVVQEVAVWPLLAPALFTGARAVPQGLLLFGPPGTGKTLIGANGGSIQHHSHSIIHFYPGRAIAAQAGATFFGISASSLGSKWIGEGEKLVKALFALAGALSPSVIFIDEIDALLAARKGDGEHESSRRLKTELLVQMEGLGGADEARRVLLVGATNRPAELDEAARRRLAKQVYIPLPCAAARRQIVTHLLRDGSACAHTLSDSDLDTLCARTEGYRCVCFAFCSTNNDVLMITPPPPRSGSDMKHLVQEAARAPLRELHGKHVDLTRVDASSVRAITIDDFRRAAKQARAPWRLLTATALNFDWIVVLSSIQVRPSVTPADIVAHEEWNRHHGAQVASTDGADSDGEWGEPVHG